ncbi:GntR family transcriptional regulator [Saccharopolyspora sp. 6T]|uniref:GntR family transcriptional regulator n=1 Tax=Saccharopolyspora sp. 6T TaxID=2877238 RepID=UPI001CD75E17|nr:GntR family transcriptional regulator [Saccharopolyspora sp. 6T]MCA1184855.1 GntR family transcriptional regulator [Saccharopolyspora sp. 6T]
MATPLVEQIAARIAEHIREERLVPGTRLVERALAERLAVSRSPARGALRLLAADGVVAAGERGGYAVLRVPDAAPVAEGGDGVETTYLRIAGDRLDGRLPERVTESGLAREYGLTSAQLSRILQRIGAEGWIERMPGYGWRFRPMLTSQGSYRDSYRFRLTIEPAALLEPDFQLDEDAVREVRAQQQHLVDGAIREVGDAELFDRNSAFHEVLVQCSGNAFFIDSLRRVDRLRRLVEYRRTLPRDRAVVRCREHVEIADLLLAGRRAEAAERLREHLDSVGTEKAGE